MNPIFYKQGTCEGMISWAISMPRLKKWPRRRIIRSQIQFTIKNISESFLHIQVKVRSSSKLLQFKSISSQMIGKSRIKHTKETLQKAVGKGIGSHVTTKLTFPFHYRPHLALSRTPHLQIEFLIIGSNKKGQEILRSGPHHLTIPVETK